LIVEFENQLAESGNDPRFHLMPAQLGKSLARMKRSIDWMAAPGDAFSSARTTLGR
jgi:hypothetical protein